MGKKSKKKQEQEEGEYSAKYENEMTSKSQSKSNVINKLKGIKKSKKSMLDCSQSNENIVKKITKIVNMNVDVPTKIKDNISNVPVPSNKTDVDISNDHCKKHKKRKQASVQDKTKNIKIQQCIDNNELKSKKKKHDIDVEAIWSTHMDNSSENLIENKLKKNGRNKIQDTVQEQDNCNEESFKETINTSNKKIKQKKKQNTQKDEVQHSVQELSSNDQVKRKKKKKQNNMEDVVNDEEIDRYCDELDEFHNKQYENWVKLIEENLNKNVKKYFLYHYLSF